MDKYSGKRLDSRYEIQELIGMGGMAYVYKAYDTLDDRTVAIKILKEEFLGNQEFMRRFKNESKAIAMLDHPNIVKVYSVSFGDRMQYIVMEYINGISLKQYMDMHDLVPQKEALHFTVQILEALQHAHENGIVHRDIKPQNIMLLQDGTIKVTDFGIARFSDSQTRTMTDKAIGSVHYIAPEQARGDWTDGKTDIYSVGVLLYEMMTGQLPFEADNAVSVALMQLQNDPTPPRELNPAIPMGLQEIILKAMQKNPKRRYQSASEMLEDIRAFRKDPNIRFYYQLDSAEETQKPVASEVPAPAAVPTPVRTSTTPRFDDRYQMREDELEEEPQKKKTGLIVGISVGAAAAAAVVAIILLFVFGVFGGGGAKELQLPNFVGQKWSEVQNNEEYAENFVFKVEYNANTQEPEDTIIRQSPNADRTVMQGSTVLLTVSSKEPTVDIPDLKDKTLAQAEAMLEELGLSYEVEELFDAEVADGNVVRTLPAAGSAVTKSTKITIYVSKGAQEMDVPNVVGDTLEEAKAKIAAAQLRLGDVTEEFSDTVPSGVIISTDPAAGEKLVKNQPMNVVVSKGQKLTDLTVNISLPHVSHPLELTAFVNGGEYLTQEVPYSSHGFPVTVTQQRGVKYMSVYLDNQLYAEYTLDFDNGTVQQTASYQFIDNSASSSQASSESSSSEASSSASSDAARTTSGTQSQ